MANNATPSARRFRPFFIVLSPVLFAGCVGLAAIVLIITRQPVFALPFIFASLGPARLMRWTMIWQSTPTEQKILARRMDHEPLIGLCRDIFRRHPNPPPP
jgi:hypothetical protein